MATTTYHNIPLPGDGSQDWVTALNRALSAITEKMVRQQLPAGTTLRWGDIAGGSYIEVSTGAGVRVIGGLDHGTSPARNLRLPQGDSFPVDVADGSVYLRTDTGVLWYRWNSTWVEVGALDGAAIEAAGGLRIEDLGVDKGSFAVSDGAAGLETVVPGADRTVLISLASSDSGWSLSTVLSLLGYALAKGEFAVGQGGNAAAAFAPGENGTVLVADSGETSGLRWSLMSDLLEVFLADRGQILVGDPDGPMGAPAPTADDQVLVSDAAVAGGVKWVDQGDLGALPGTRTRVAGDLYLYANYL